jgi:hypothetical protein
VIDYTQPLVVLPNGATVLECERVRADPATFLALCRSRSPQPYAVWRVDADGNTFLGQHFDRLSEAAEYFAKRVAKIERVRGVTNPGRERQKHANRRRTCRNSPEDQRPS